ncbi:MAG: DUF433 domain-containing protein [Chloroflexi bacterium]|nr:DUF433 domain-containing protein [Chloroflexota bacterium]MBU1660941.1 DUF433 domain-containing protein [Chloroflexota bacterium]
MLVDTRYEHVIMDEANVPIITGTNTKVVELVLDNIAYGWSPEELHFQHPELTLGQIYSALSYYWDHKEELDQDIERRLQRVNHIREAAQQLPLETRLKTAMAA